MSKKYFLILTAFAIFLAGRSQAAELRVKAGQSIVAAVKKAEPGDIIVVEPGTYKEAITVDKPFITLKGVVDGLKRPILEGDNTKGDGVLASGDHFKMTGFRIQNYKGNGVTTQGSKDIYLADLDIENTRLYGVYPVNCERVTIERTRTKKVADAGLYVGQSRDIVVRWNVVTDSVMGIEIENSEKAVVEYNMVQNNTGGILVYMLPGLKEKTGNTTQVLNNFVVENNHPNFADPKGTVAKVPPGSGILILAFDDVVVAGNFISGNNSFGVAVTDMDMLDDPKKDPGIEPHSDRVRIEENYYLNNGAKTGGMLKAFAPKGADVIVMSRGKGHCVNPVPGMSKMLDAKALPPCPGDRELFMRDAHERSDAAYALRMKERLSMMHHSAPPDLGFDLNHPPKGTHVVLIEGMTYKPMKLTVKKGDKVVWLNKDGAAHTVTSSKGGTDLDPTGPLQSPMMDKNGVYQYTFNKPGKFIYLCLPHISQAPMRDAVVVVNP